MAVIYKRSSQPHVPEEIRVFRCKHLSYLSRESLQDCVIAGKVMTPTYTVASFTPISKPSLAEFYRYLGVHLDCLLDWDVHVMLSSCLQQRLHRLRVFGVELEACYCLIRLLESLLRLKKKLTSFEY